MSERGTASIMCEKCGDWHPTEAHTDVTSLSERAEQSEDRKITIRLDQLSPDVTEERIKKLLSTIPKGFADNVLVIDFVDTLGPVASADSETLPGNGVISFYRRAKDEEPKILWGQIFLHEIGHVNDWMRHSNLTSPEREKFAHLILERSQAHDRYQSSYVESGQFWSNEGIDNRDDAERKASEYWAEIARAYLSAEKPEAVLPEKDIKIVRSIIEKTDPKFNQHEARLLREVAIAELVRPVLYRMLDSRVRNISSKEIDAFKNFLNSEQESIDEKEYQGRLKLTAFLKQWGQTPERRQYASLFIQKYTAKHNAKYAFEALKSTGFSLEVEHYAKANEDLRKLHDMLTKQGIDVVDFDLQCETLIESYRIQFGLRSGEFNSTEYNDLITTETDDVEWIFVAAQWKVRKKSVSQWL